MPLPPLLRYRIGQRGVNANSRTKHGTTVVVSGVVEQMTEKDEPRIADATGSAHIYIWPVKVPAGVGEMISANGFVDDDPGPLEIYARHAARGTRTRHM